jgi:large subunit ribosomal protein L30
VSKKKNTEQKQVKVTLVKSPFGRKKDQMQTVIGLGLGKTNSSRVLEATPSVMGMVYKIKHLVTFEYI